MKKIPLSFLFFLSFPALAQNSNPHPNSTPLSDYSNKISEKLVALALQNPDNEIADLQTNIARYQVSSAKAEWVNTISASANLNEFTIEKNNPYALYYPKYNLGISIPLGFFTTRSNQVKIAKANLQITQAKKNSLYRQIKAAVLSKYQDYLMYKQLLTLQGQATENANNDYLLAQKKFSNGGIPIETYNSASRAYNDALAAKIKAQHDLNVAQLDLEQLIGTSLDDVLNQK